MANHGSKFVSVNLNKSYGQQHQPSHHTHYPQFNGSGRGRTATGSLGGMLVLSRTRGAAPKIVNKLSAPPPLNLPSLRKEHEKFDMSGPSTGVGAGSGSRPNSSGLGWTKPVEKTEIRADTAGLDGTSATTGGSRGVGSYMPPSARFSEAGIVGPTSSVDKAVFLRGEDFPTLQAARPVSSGTPKKQKDGLPQKQKHVVRDEVAENKEGSYRVENDVGPPSGSSNHTTRNQFVENDGKGNGIWKQEGYFPDPLPLVRMNPRFDWADDERDMGHGFVNQGRDVAGYSNRESYSDRDFNLPRPSILPHKPPPSQYGRWGEQDNEAGKQVFSEVLKVDMYSKDARSSSQEGMEVNKWRNSPPSQYGLSSQETGNYRVVHNNMANENKHAPSQYMDISHNRDPAFGRREFGFVGHQHKQHHNNSYHGIHQVTKQPFKYKADNFQNNNNLSRSYFAASGGKINHVADPILNIGRYKRFSNGDRDYGATFFDERDIFSEGLVGVMKRKKDVTRSTGFHDPVRESFEAELERVQKIQELERQRSIEEQERALEQARREEDERHRRIREEEERLRKLEEEARETAWRAEQERVEAIKKSEEQRIAREDEKRRMQLEDERRKLAAKQKLEELEARMAMRQAMTLDEKQEVQIEKKLVSRNLDLDEIGYHNDQRWNYGHVADLYEKNREMDSEFHNGNADRYGGDNNGWGQGRPCVNAHPPYPEQLYPHSETNNLYNNIGRSRYSMRQPRVLPPPLLPSQRPNFSRGTEHTGDSSTFLDNSVRYAHAERTESSVYYGSSNQRALLPSNIFRLKQENNHSEHKNLNDGSRCDSRSSLSVSSPPTSPPHLSHDELDESRDAQVTSSIAAHSVNSGLMVPDNNYCVEDEEWTIESADTMQKQEEYAEDEDGYREKDEVRERDGENLELSQNFEGLELEEAESPHAMDNVVLGFDQGVEVVLPNDDFEKKIDIPESSVGIVEGRGTIDDEKSALQGSIDQCVGDSSDGTVLAAQKITSTTVTSKSCNDVPSLSSSGGQADLPVMLQFGLFSGPSLIPSHVPSIQIGSIQMPLHVHPPAGQALTHMHPSQPPMFQFGQLRYTSSISQSMSILHQPKILGHFNINQNGSDSLTTEPSRENVVELPSLPKNNNQPSYVSRENPAVEKTILKGYRNEDITSNDKAKTASDKKTKPKSYIPSSKSKAPESQSQFVGGDRNYNGPRGLGPFSGGRGRRFAYAVKGKNTTVINVKDHDMQVDPNGFKRRSKQTVQRTEFRVRENYDRRPAPVSFNNSGLDDNRSTYTGKAVGVFMRNGSKRGSIFNRTMRPRIEPEPSVSGNVTSMEVSGDGAAKDLSVKSQSTLHSGETSLKRNASEDDVDAPLQSGVVCVFKQPGIEAPSDEDDFIEVRSKRQMLNVRREQKEKEIMAKAQTTKPPFKSRTSRQKDVVSRSYNIPPVPLASGEVKNSQLNLTSESPQSMNASSQPPIGTPTINSYTKAIMSTQAGVVSNGVNERVPGVKIGSTNKVISLSQSRIDKAMKTNRHDSHIPTAGGKSSTSSEPILPTPPILTKDKTFTSGASPVNSLLAGEKIQFGAVTSPTVLPSSSRVVSHGIGAPGSNRPDPQMSQSFPEKEDSLFIPKEKPLTTDHVQDCEAEAAASAVAVAAISSDETVRNGSGSVNDTTCFCASGNKGMTTGAIGHHHSASQSQSEELLTVSLPADLSVETTPISLWPPLPSPHTSSNQILSHFPTGSPSHFPFYEMNPFIGPSGGIQGPPHMVVYNHFSPVGQVGLSFMGTTYIPSGNQADWKNNAPVFTMHSGEGDSNNANTSNVQQNGLSMSGHIQNLSMPISDVSPFQTASDLPLQAQWGNIAASQPSLPKLEGAPTSSNGNNSPSFTDNTSIAPFSSSQQGLPDPSVAVQTPSESSNALESSKTDVGENSKMGNASSFHKKNVAARHGSNSKSNGGGYGYQRGGQMTRNRTNSGGNEFYHRRMGYHGRGGMEKSFYPPRLKMKQVYVVKQKTSGGSAT